MSSRELRLFVMVMLAMLIGLGWAYQSMCAARVSASAARLRANESEQLSRRILALRAQPSVIVAAVPEVVAATTAIMSAANSSAVGESNIERIDPEPPRRLGETAYQEFPVRVRLRNLSIGKFIAFMRTVESDPEVRVISFRLTAPRNSAAGPAEWAADLTLSRLLYAPIKGK